MLKKTRVVVSLILFVLITLYFLDFAELLPLKLSFLADIQFLPALLSLNALILIALVVLTFVFGRVYCSSICPMGVYQDVVAWLSKKVPKKLRKKRRRYTYSREKTVLRWMVFGATLIAFLFGFTFLVGLLDPYGAYGRMVTHIFRPAYLAGNNVQQSIFTSFDNYTFYKVGIYGLGVFSLAVALITMLSIGFLAWKNGRTFCNTICPVGTTLGFFSKFSIFKIRFVESDCNLCGLCAMNCKASCIDSKRMKVDYSRCVNCFNCIEVCNRSAMKYTPVLFGKKTAIGEKLQDEDPKPTETVKVDDSKRRFLYATAVTTVAATSMIAQKTTGVALRKEIKRENPIAPPGALSVKNLSEKCISCHLCVSKCPSHVIKPAFLEYGLSGMMQPRMYFDHGFCNYDCTICTDVCPTEALVPLSKKDKHHTQIGKVQFILENCIVYYDETSCGACSEHCPTQAVSMVPYKGSLTIPHTETDICVGCGGCEYVCPAIPYKAIYVEGVSEHNELVFEHEEQQEIEEIDFGF
ncbi:MAG: 4Fe-4S dicluster domain-containing protein [Porphyromonadaceae bacterium]|jgi:ferredoxin|nr:4Fe-4S dicluster domain-containing protein [Porphyromonadaceae bacterium]